MPPRNSIDACLSELLDDPSTSMALRSMIRALLERDPLDALADAEVLVDLLHRRFDALRGAPPTTGEPALVVALQGDLERAPMQHLRGLRE